MEYRVKLQPDRETGQVVVSFPDVPEAHTFGVTNAEALRRAVDALATALDGYMKDRRQIPLPTKARAKGGGNVVRLPNMMALKVGLYSALLASGLSKYALAKKLGWHPPQVDRLLSLRHPSKIENIAAAADVLEQGIGVSLNPKIRTNCPTCGNETTISFQPGLQSAEYWACPQCDGLNTVTVRGSGVVAVASVGRRARA